jgi:hypothetical protein
LVEEFRRLFFDQAKRKEGVKLKINILYFSPDAVIAKNTSNWSRAHFVC